VELLFRESRTLYDLDEFNTTNPAVIEILLYAAVLTLLVSRELLELVIEHADDDTVFPPERWAATFRSHAQRILKRLSNYLGYSPPPLLERMVADAQRSINNAQPYRNGSLPPLSQLLELAKDQWAAAILHTIDRYHCDSVLLTQGTPSRLGRMYDEGAVKTVLAEADCDMFIENPGSGTGEHGRILLAAGIGPYTGLAAVAARALALDSAASTDAIHVFDSALTARPAQKHNEYWLSFPWC
jgi:hypothetical protein